MKVSIKSLEFQAWICDVLDLSLGSEPAVLIAAFHFF